MWTTPGLVERVSLAWAKAIHNNGGHPDVSVGTMRFALQLWISMFLIFAIASGCSAILGTFEETFTSLIIIGFLRYFSGGWHFRSLDICIFVTTALAIAIPLLPNIEYVWLILLNGSSLLLVLLFAPTGHGQQFRSANQRRAFRWISLAIVAMNFLCLTESATVSILSQSLTLISTKRRCTR